jgi:hypothetical protein
VRDVASTPAARQAGEIAVELATDADTPMQTDLVKGSQKTLSASIALR